MQEIASKVEIPDLNYDLLNNFIKSVQSTDRDVDERKLVVDSAISLLENIYVHLPLKISMHAVDPVQRLKILNRHLGKMSELVFQRELIEIFVGLRDIHTTYILPEPFAGKIAFLPFLVETFFENNKRRYMVSKIAKGFEHSKFREGVLLSHWNGVPIERAVWLIAESGAGSNIHARHARGLERMTIRPLRTGEPPDEDWVDVRYVSNSEVFELRFFWNVVSHPIPLRETVFDSGEEAALSSIGIDEETERIREMKKNMFVPKIIKREKDFLSQGAAIEGESAHMDTQTESLMPDVFSFRSIETKSGHFGYIKIYTFNIADSDQFLKEFIRICSLVPQNGLILDVRGNGGGDIRAAEKILQVLTSKKIEPERFHFIASPLTLQLCQKIGFLKKWADPIDRAIETGVPFSQGFPITPPEECNEVGQKYYGPVVLITDALCYSATDLFTAGFQDHGIGPIIGTNRNTGAGGANVFQYPFLRTLMGANAGLQELPENGASFTVAIRRSTRVRDNLGVPVEDLGIKPDYDYQMTSRDVLHKNIDLLNEAVKKLASK